MYIFLYIIILFFTVLQSLCVKFYHKTKSDVWAFNALRALFAAIPFFIALLFGANLHLPTIAYGCIYGVLLSTSMVAGYKALQLGPMSLTSMIVSFSVVIPLFYGVFIGEKLNTFNIVGLCLLAVAMGILCEFPTQKEEKKETNYGKWICLIFLTFCCNGLNSITQKIHQEHYPAMYVKEFMATAMLVCTIIFACISLAKIKSPKAILKTKGGYFGIIAGVGMAIVHFCTTELVHAENASILFPAITAGTLTLSLLSGRFILKEKLKPKQIVTVVLGITSLILLKL